MEVAAPTASHTASSRFLNWPAITALAGKAWFAYLMILLLQLGVVRVAWQHRDTTSGDTSSYFLNAWDWHREGKVNIAWSPLYTSFYGSILSITSDVYAATLLHRLIIVCAATLLVLAVMRRLLPPHLAWCIAAWWAILPINFNTLYEVHLFALLPVLLSWLAVLAIPTAWGRGLCLAILCAATVLVRNELGLASALFGAACLIYEWRAWHTELRSLYAKITPYALPLGVSILICLGFYSRSTVRGPVLRSALHGKHTLNMSQVFTFGYQQRHPEIEGIDPWVGYQAVMREHFGNELPKLSEMITANPAAVWEHFWWNLSLTPNGLQVLLFNSTSGAFNPDYAHVRTGATLALVLTVVMGLIWVSGFVVVLRERSHWWSTWIKPRGMAWCAMLAVAVVALPVIMTQRPRPSYLFSLSVAMMATTGFFLMVLATKNRRTPSLAAAMPILMFALVLFAPRAYRVRNPHPAYLNLYAKRMEPYAELLRRPNAVLLQQGYGFETMSYVGKTRNRALDYRILDQWPADQSLEAFLKQRGVNLVMMEESLLQKLENDSRDGSREFLAGESAGDWQLLGSSNVPSARWRLYACPPVAAEPPTRTASAREKNAGRSTTTR